VDKILIHIIDERKEIKTLLTHAGADEKQIMLRIKPLLQKISQKRKKRARDLK